MYYFYLSNFKLSLLLVRQLWVWGRFFFSFGGKTALRTLTECLQFVHEQFFHGGFSGLAGFYALSCSDHTFSTTIQTTLCLLAEAGTARTAFGQ